MTPSDQSKTGAPEAGDTATTSAIEMLSAAEGGTLLDELPDHCRPASAAAAYAVQDAWLARRGPPIAWKVAPALADETPRCAPIFDLVWSGGNLPPSLRNPFAELEIGLILGADVDGSGGLAREDIAGAVAVVEILDSRFVDRKAVSRWTALADLQSNACIVRSASTMTLTGLEFADLATEMWTGGTAIARTKALASTDVVLEAVDWLSAHLARRGQPLRRGQIILTGARVGPVPLPTGATVEGHIAGIGAVTAHRSAATSGIET